MIENTDRDCCNESSKSSTTYDSGLRKLAIIDKVDSGKTRKLLNACSQADGLFICAHPERVLDKCNAYGIKPVRSASFSQAIDLIKERKDDKFYIDDVDKLIHFLKDTYDNDKAFIYLSLISFKVEGYTFNYDGESDSNVLYIRKLMENR